MRVPWGEHLDMARCCALTAEHDLAAAVIVMAGGLHLLQRDLLVATWELEVQELALATSTPRAARARANAEAVPASDAHG
jgi:hypothetical protein